MGFQSEVNKLLNIAALAAKLSTKKSLKNSANKPAEDQSNTSAEATTSNDYSSGNVLKNTEHKIEQAKASKEGFDSVMEYLDEPDEEES